MGVFSQLRPENIRIKGLSLTDPKAWDRTLWNLAGSQSLSGEDVSEYTALTYSAVWCAISLIAGTIGALPLHLMQRKGETKRMVDNLKLYTVMHDQWNPYMTAMAGRECMMAHILSWGNGYAEKEKNGMGDIVALWPITPNRVTPLMQNGELTYRIHMDKEAPITLTREKILHIPGLGFDGFIGYSPIAMARKSIGLGMAMESFGSLYFGAGTHPGVVVSHPGQLKEPTKLSNALSAAYSGLGKSHRLMLLEEGMKIEKIGYPPEDSQFLESRQFQIPEISRWFNVPPHKLKDLTKSSFSNIEQEQISFVMDSILPWLVRLEQNYRMQLLTDSDKSLSGYGRLYFKHNFDGLLRADATGRANLYRALFNVGGVSINEILRKEEMEPSTEEFAEDHFVPMNMIPLRMLREFLEKKQSNEPIPSGKIPGDGNNGGLQNE
jgi:HK97 family phage portal protein